MNIHGLKKKIKETRSRIKSFENELQGEKNMRKKQKLNYNIINAKERITRLKFDIKDLRNERKRKMPGAKK